MHENTNIFLKVTLNFFWMICDLENEPFRIWETQEAISLSVIFMTFLIAFVIVQRYNIDLKQL